MAFRRCVFVCVVMMAALCLAQEQLPSTPQPQPTAGQPTTPSDQNNSASQNSENLPEPQSEKKPSRLKRALDRAKPQCINVEGRGTCWDDKQKQSSGSDAAQAGVPQNQAPPRENIPAGESSSRQTQIDISPPPDDVTHEGADTSDVNEFHSYDPHRAAKDVEVGDFYFHKKNYIAAESRYQGALQWKPNDAIAMYRLAESEEKLGKTDEAVKYYQLYLKTLPEGDFAKDAKEAIARLSK